MNNPYEAPEARQGYVPPRQYQPQPKEQPQEHVSARPWPAAIALVIVGSLLWLAGAKYTLLGWVTGLNWFLGWLDLPARIPAPVGYYMLIMIPVGLLYSLVEVKRPWKHRSKNSERTALYWVVWALLVVSDIGTTFMGVSNPPSNAWAISHQLAEIWLLAGAWAAVLTFVPEWMITGALKLIRR